MVNDSFVLSFVLWWVADSFVFLLQKIGKIGVGQLRGSKVLVKFAAQKAK